jgi:hypothetical protein
MTRKEEEQFLAVESWLLHKEKMAAMAPRAIMEGDWVFLCELGVLGEALKPKKPKTHYSVPERIQLAHLDLYRTKPGRRVTKPMINMIIDPEKKLSAQQLRVAYKAAHLSWLPTGKAGRPKKANT